MPLTLDEIERYHRQALLPEWGAAGQEAVRAATARVAGRGAAAEAAARYLAGAGVGLLVLEDEALLATVRALNPLVVAELGLPGEAAAAAPCPSVLVEAGAGRAAIVADPDDGERAAAGAALALEAIKAILGLPHQARVHLPAPPATPGS